MLNAMQQSTTFAYADDTAVVVSNKNIHLATEIMQNQLNVATKWCHDNGLNINSRKTKIMHIKPTHFEQHNIQLKFHELTCLHNTNNQNNDTCTTYIELVTSYKYLGVYVDNHFKWNVHVENLQKKLRKSAYMMYHLSNCATYSVLRQAYFSMVESYIRHGIAAWGSATHCRLLQSTQDRILKILKKNHRFSQKNQNNNSNNYNHNSNINNFNSINNNISNNIISNTNISNNNINNISNNSHNTNINNNIVNRNINNNTRSNNNISNNNISSNNNINNISNSIHNANINNNTSNNNVNTFNTNNNTNNNIIDNANNIAKDQHDNVDGHVDDDATAAADDDDNNDYFVVIVVDDNEVGFWF
ncbi:probable cyclin-dependent serine/threonine-protein kinase DDB_G0292550 [Calliphora vicina]|uniref:probable cyclin-dependent serine/threonine-protein kinase DDB_G0292550 n=1 Tax=Calliphora vicina TaxID=7373 RepID=UPI00325A7253